MICFTSAYSQKKSIKKTVNNLNTYLEIYETLQSHGQSYYTIDSLKVTREDLIKEFEAPLEQIDSLDNYEAIGIIQSKIDDLLRQVLKHKKANSIDVASAFKDNLSVIKSNDNKLYSFSIDEKTGGSYRSHLSWMYYLDKNRFTEYPVNDDWHLNQSDKPTVFEANGYHEIKSFNSFNKTRYLLFGNFKACGSCYIEYITLVHFEKDNFVLDFEYSLESRDYDQKIYFDEGTKSLSVFYDTDDLTEDCFCSNEASNNYWHDNSNDSQLNSDGELIRLSCSCLFDFDGKTYKLSKRCSKIIKKED